MLPWTVSIVAPALEGTLYIESDGGSCATCSLNSATAAELRSFYSKEWSVRLMSSAWFVCSSMGRWTEHTSLIVLEKVFYLSIITFKMNCKVCSVNESKYKCPTCKILYCSLTCYKTHKQDCSKPKEVTIQEPAAVEAPSVLEDEEEEIYKVPQHKLAYLGSSQKLKSYLSHSKLRVIIR